MSYEILYNEVQDLEPKISTKMLRNRALDLTQFTKIKEQWTGIIDKKIIRGFFIEGPMGPPVPLKRDEALIVLVRGLEKDWRRLVYTKELMHVFDRPEEKANTPEKYDLQAQRYSDPTAEASSYYKASITAYWRALGLLCPEKHRLDYKRAIEADEMSIEVVAAKLKIPARHVLELFRDDFPAIIENVK